MDPAGPTPRVAIASLAGVKRLLRLLTISAAVAAGLAAVAALRRKKDPLPTVPTNDGAAWPELTALADAAVETTPPAAAAPAGDPVPAEDPVPAGDAAPTADSGPATGWVDPTDDGECPDGYPIKAKASSKIFHSPGQMNYERTAPDRCYADAEAAQADGFRPAKR